MSFAVTARNDLLKRSFDLIVAAVGVTLTTPLFVVIAVLIKLESPGPIFYRSFRVGLRGEEFEVLKFRTMRNSTTGPGVTRRGDPRVTRVGRVLRLTKFDELPQLLNVLAGDMSLVGPRPEDPRYVAHYTPEQWRVLSVRPGITSPASLAYRHEEEVLASISDDVETAYLTEVLPSKLRMDLDYVSRQSFLVDLRVLLRTAASFVFPRWRQ